MSPIVALGLLKRSSVFGNFVWQHVTANSITSLSLVNFPTRSILTNSISKTVM